MSRKEIYRATRELNEIKNDGFKWAALFVVVVGTSLATWSAISLYKSEVAQLKFEFEESVNLRAESFAREVASSVQVLHELAVLARTSEPTWPEFRLIASDMVDRYPSIQALEWAPLVRQSERAELLSPSVEEFGTQSFEITELSASGEMMSARIRELYYPIYYLYPYHGNERAWGFDLASDRLRNDALERASYGNSPSLVSGIRLVQQSDSEPSVGKFFFAQIPVYIEPEAGVRVQYSPVDLKGFVVSVYETKKIFESSALSDRPLGIEMHLLQYTPEGEAIELYRHQSRTGGVAHENVSYVRELPDLFGADWAIEARPTLAYVESRMSNAPHLRALFGILGCVVTALFILYEGRQYQAITYLNRELNQLSNTDGLTGLKNRRAFDAVLDVEWRRATREARELTAIMMDVDYFKKYNDRYGHLDGDRCLQLVADSIQSSIKRSSDYCARYGGEEFVILLTGKITPESVIENIRAGLDEMNIMHESSPVSSKVTLSFGIATIAPAINDKKEAIIKHADIALYQAKAQGRNRFLRYEEGMSL